MPMYALATIPLITTLKQQVPEVNQVWYADDSAGSGEISRLRAWWDHINNYGPKFGYFTNTNKTWLLTKIDRSSNRLCGDRCANHHGGETLPRSTPRHG